MRDAVPRRFGDLVGALVGPAGPELTCEQCFDELDRYVELELAGHNADAAVAGMQAHLEGCPACAEDHDSLHALLAAERAVDGSGETPTG